MRGEEAEGPGRVRQLQRAFQCVRIRDDACTPAQVSLERGFDRDLLPISAVGQSQISEVEVRHL